LDVLIKEISEIAEVGLDNVDPVGITGVLESHSQPVAYPGILFGGGGRGVKKIQLRTKGKGFWGAVAH